MTVRRNRDKKKPRGRAVAQRSADSDAQNYPANTAPLPRCKKGVFPSPPKLPDALATFGREGGLSLRPPRGAAGEFPAVETTTTRLLLASPPNLKVVRPPAVEVRLPSGGGWPASPLCVKALLATSISIVPGSSMEREVGMCFKGKKT